MDPGWLRALLLILTFAAVLLAVEAVLSSYLRNRNASQAINQRMSMIGHGVSRLDTMSRLRRQEHLVIKRLPSLLQGPGRRLERMLMAAGMTMPTGQILLAVLIAPVVLLGMFVMLVVLSGSSVGAGQMLLLAVISLSIGFGMPVLFLQARATRRRKKMQEQFPVALDVFVRGLRAGHPVAAALDLLTVEMPDPIGSQFGLVVDEVTYGADLRDALTDLAERWDLDDMRMFVISLSVQQETGGNLAEILENLSKVIRERTSLFLKVRALSSEGRMTAIMLTVLPVLALTGLMLFNPSFYLDVADDPAFIPGFLGLILLYTIGVVVIRRLVDLKV